MLAGVVATRDELMESLNVSAIVQQARGFIYIYLAMQGMGSYQRHVR